MEIASTRSLVGCTIWSTLPLAYVPIRSAWKRLGPTLFRAAHRSFALTVNGGWSRVVASPTGDYEKLAAWADLAMISPLG